jgi:energy-converting hydrogenase Eha subunit A
LRDELLVALGVALVAGWLVMSTALERRAIARGRPAPRPFTRAWSIPAAIILAGALIAIFGNLTHSSLDTLVVGLAVAFLGVLLRLYDRIQRVFRNP